MGWEGDHIFPRAGVWKLTSEDGTIPYGVVATWYESVAGTRYVNEWRVNLMPLPDQVRVTRTAAYGAIQGDTLVQRRNSFQAIWNQYKADNQDFDYTATYPANEPGVVEREWTGTMQDSQGFNLSGSASATANPGTDVPDRNGDEQI